MNMEFMEFSAKTVNDAVTEACKHFTVPSDKLEYEVIEEGSTGFLGFNSKPAVIKARIIEEKLDEGKNLVFLTLGDPMLYSTYMYIFRALKRTEYTVETIPGIPAFLGIASYIGMPVTEWEENVLIIPATADPEKIDRALSAADNAVIMKVYKKFAFIQEELRKHHMIKNAVMVSRAGLPDEIIERDLDSLPSDYRPNYLSTIIAKRGN